MHHVSSHRLDTAIENRDTKIYLVFLPLCFFYKRKCRLHMQCLLFSSPYLSLSSCKHLFFLNKVPQNCCFMWKYYTAAWKEVIVPKYINNCFKFCMDLAVCILKVKLVTDFFYSCTLFFVVWCFSIHSKMLTVIAVAYIWCFKD